MNIGYVIDLSDVLDGEDLHIPFVDGLRYKKVAGTPKQISPEEVLEMRNDAMRKNQQIKVDKHLFFFVITNQDITVLKELSNSIKKIQQDTFHFHREENEMHILFNLCDEQGCDIKTFEMIMRLADAHSELSACVYTWIINNYDYSSVRPIDNSRRSHAMVRLIQMLCKHRLDIQLLPFVNTITDEVDEKGNPIVALTPTYNLFGDSSVFFDDEERAKKVHDYYCFKNLQHLLNLPDNRNNIGGLDDYLRTNVLPYAGDPKEIEQRIDATSDVFLKQQRLPIEAARITEKTQGLLLKSSDDDEDYLVSASDNKLVFLEELRNSHGWQLANMDTFLDGYQHKVGLENEIQEKVSEKFLDELYKDKFNVHEREDFTTIVGDVSSKRIKHVEQFKQKVDKYLNDFLNQNDEENYVLLLDPLTPQESAKHRSNIDYGIAFMDYLESGCGDYLVDQEIAGGDANFKAIRAALVKEESKRSCDYETKKNAIETKYAEQEGGQPSAVKVEMGKIDQRIEQCRVEKVKCDFQIDHWINRDADKKLTARSKAFISIIGGVLAAIIWIIVSIKWLSSFFGKIFDNYSRFQWEVFSALVLAGLIIGLVIAFKAKRRRKEAEEALEKARQRKKKYMEELVQEMIDVTKAHYDFILAYQGLKTMDELIDYVEWKKEDLVHFRKVLFKMLVNYGVLVYNNNERVNWDDVNTLELVDGRDVKSILFESGKVPYCFSQDGISLSNTFVDFKRKKVGLETSRITLGHTSQNFDQAALEQEIIACMDKDKDADIKYSPLKEKSILPNDEKGVEMDDINQGSCGDCYFMATLAAIAKMKPDYIIGANGMVEELGDEHRFFRVKFYDRDGKRVSVDVDNRFWITKGGQPIYAKQGISNDPEGSSYDPWVMAVEKAWAKTNNNGYDGIRGTSQSKERMRKVEYSFAVTGKSAFYCRTKSVSDHEKLLQMMKKHFLEDHLPITLYSADEDDNEFKDNRDKNLVCNHAYALRAINDDKFDIFNPWNHPKEEGRGKHFENVDIKFIKDNFDVVVFFGIKETNFDSFERDLTQNASEGEVTKGIEMVLNNSFAQLEIDKCHIGDLLTDSNMGVLLQYSDYLFSRSRLFDTRGANGEEKHVVFLEGGKTGVCDDANKKLLDYLMSNIPGGTVVQLYDADPQGILRRDDDKQSLTLLKLSPHYLLDNFQPKKKKENNKEDKEINNN